MKNVKVGKSIIKFLDDKNNNTIANYEVRGDEIDLEIFAKINEDFGIRVYPEYNAWSGKFTDWTIDIIDEGHSRYYGSCKTQKDVCEALEDRIRYCNRVYRNKLGEKYQSLSKDDLIALLVQKDIESMK